MKGNIGFIIPSLKNGGAERVLSTISLNLDKNIKQYIFTWNAKEQDYEFNGDIIEINVKNSTSLIKNIFVLIKRVIEVKKYKKEYNIQTCISHLEGPNIVNLLSKGKEKVIITVHNFQSKERVGLYGFIFKMLIKIFYNRADKIVSVSKAIKEDLVKNFNINEDKIEVIYNPFDCEKIEELSREEIDSEYEEIFKNKVIINVGRLTNQKGQWHLIKAFVELKAQQPDVKLIILGKGELEEQLKELVVNLNLQESVLFLGFQKNPFKYIANADLFALTSLYEGFPMCIAEAMACGTPVIAVDCKSGPREMLDLEYNINVETKNIEYVKAGILTKAFSCENNEIDCIINNEEIIFGNALKEAINNREKLNECKMNAMHRVKEFDSSVIVNKWEMMINNM